MEGHYLYRLLSDTFEEQERRWRLVAVGWAAPLLPIILYTAARAAHRDTRLCWAEPAEQATLTYQ